MPGLVASIVTLMLSGTNVAVNVTYPATLSTVEPVGLALPAVTKASAIKSLTGPPLPYGRSAPVAVSGGDIVVCALAEARAHGA
jgi:hypothetical protein